MSDTPCPLCGSAQKMKRPRVLYGHQVCRRCWSGFITRRQLAWIVDVFFLQFVVGFLFGFFGAMAGSGKEPATGPIVLAFVGVLAFKDGFAGHSFGKWICGVQVVDRESGTPAGFGRSFLRNWVAAIPLMPLVIAFSMNRGPRIGDGMAKTRVIWKRYRDHPVFSSPAAAAKVFE
ncbi:MAG: RDD family protein [Planctomycetes bacterium]|nr:RDD family protein [Planctomycetota bacterium]